MQVLHQSKEVLLLAAHLRNTCILLVIMISRSFLFNKGHLPVNISKDGIKDRLVVKRKRKSDASTTKAFYFGKYLISTLLWGGGNG